jgi:hypothetical protein
VNVTVGATAVVCAGKTIAVAHNKKAAHTFSIMFPLLSLITFSPYRCPQCFSGTDSSPFRNLAAINLGASRIVILESSAVNEPHVAVELLDPWWSGLFLTNNP